jgi:octaprenyl-diphosphate synthase
VLVNQAIIDRMQSPVALIPELAGHLIASGGKRLRPMLTLACASMLGYTGTRHHKLAACVEFIHTATLLHDDVVDDSGLRRGRKTANTLWGNQPSVLVGDFLFSRAFELMVEDGNLAVLKILSRASAIIAQGEVQQLTTAHDLTCTEDRYLEVITSKTAVLFAAACQIAAVVAEREASVEAALETYGRNLGIAFQLVDDALDYNSTASDMGKDAGDDFREGKLTLPVILAYARADGDQRKFWERCIGRLKQEEGDLNRAIALMTSANAISDTLGRAKLYGARAKDALATLPDGAAKAILLDTVDFAISRAF